MSAWILAGVAIKGTAVFAAAWLITVALRRSSAATRHLVWTAAAAAVLVLPSLSMGLPSWRLTAMDRIFAVDTGLVFRVFATDHATAAPVAPATSAHARAAAKPSSRMNWKSAIPVVWAGGTAVMLLQMLLACAGLWRKRRAARPFGEDSRVSAIAANLATPLVVPVLKGEPDAMPITFGLLRPVVFLPSCADDWTDERLRVVLLHELAHVRRGDVATHLLARIALAIHWWNPAAWMAWREFLKERERATDDMVLSAGARATEYASHLLEVARSFRSTPATAWAAVAMARGSQLEGRLLSILDSRVRRGTARRLAPLAAVLVAVAVVAPFAALEAQERTPALPEIDATIRAAIAQRSPEIVDRAANAYIALQKYDAAQTLLETSLKIRGDVSGEQSGAYAAGLVKLGELFERRGQQKEAGEFYVRALALGDRPEIAPALYRAGLVVLPKDPSVARDLLQRAVNVDPTGPKAGPATSWLAVIRQREPGGTSEAEMLFQRALTLEDPDSLDTAMTLELYWSFLQSENRMPESQPLMERAAAIRNARVSGTPSLPAAMPAPEMAGGSALRVGSGVSSPKLLKKVEPAYSEEARAMKWQGTVLLYVEIQPDGTAQNIRVLKGIPFGLNEKAVEAVRQWVFAPGMKNGAAVPVQAQIEVNFKLL